MIEYYEFKQTLEQLLKSQTLSEAKAKIMKSLMDVEDKIRDYEAQLEEQYKQEQDSEISL